MNSDVQETFNNWRIILNHPRAKLDSTRRKVIENRLADGYSVDDLSLAFEGCACDYWHMGGNDRNTIFDSITLILRDADHVERFMEIGEKARMLMAQMQARKAEAQSPQEPRQPPTQEQILRARAALQASGVNIRRLQ